MDNSVSHAISSEEASRKCSDLASLLSELNDVQNTSLPLGHPGLKPLLEYFISRDYDFGAVYSRTRYIWPGISVDEENNIFELFKSREAVLLSSEEKRRSSISGRTIHDPYTIRPRRIWDLYAHRTVPLDYAGDDLVPRPYWAVSHSWSDDRVYVMSPVNAYEWPVPLPRDVALEDVRIELLNMGAEYVWLDVLCLRQKSEETGEIYREEEWKIDVPTIGNVYTDGAFRIVRYFNGLGKDFSRDGWNDEHHWLNRAWTLQEIKFDSVNAGFPPGIDQLAEKSNDDGSTLGDRLALIGRLEVAPHSNFDDHRFFFEIIEAMRARYSSEPVDKVAGIGMLLRCHTLPVYKEKQSDEEAFSLLIQHMPPRLIETLLFGFHIPGDGDHRWRPSWKQLMTNRNLIPPPRYIDAYPKEIHLTKDGHVHLVGPTLVATFTPPLHDVPDKMFQQASIVVEKGGRREEFSMSAPGAALAAKGVYRLVGDTEMRHWVLCQARPKQPVAFEKVAIIHMSDEDIGRLGGTKTRSTLLV